MIRKVALRSSIQTLITIDDSSREFRLRTANLMYIWLTSPRIAIQSIRKRMRRITRSIIMASCTIVERYIDKKEIAIFG